MLVRRRTWVLASENSEQHMHLCIHIRWMPEQVRGGHYNALIPSSQLAKSDERANVLRAEAEAAACLFVAFRSDFLFVITHDFLADTVVELLSIGDETTMLLARARRVGPGVP